ncbi:MAG: hypothetical protein IJC76_01900 [Lachnospiraceae bacterium]|nr:hypothetical protein [Lachnospiraceae bacterium]
MNSKFKSFIKNFSYAFMANVITMLISVIMTLFLPKILGVEEFSYWQLYLFYGTYIMYSSLGWCDGLYLKYGGKEYDKLNPKMISSQFWYLAIYETLFSIIFAGALILFIDGIDKRFVIIISFISTTINILRYMLQYILEATNRIREYSTIIITERLLFVTGVGICWIAHIDDYRFLIYSEVVARTIAAIVGMLYCRRVIFSKMLPCQETLTEAKDLIKGGYKLLCANLTSQLVIGIVRFAIEDKWGTIQFGKVSLTLSMSNMLITCISAIGIVLFPTLRRTSEEKLPQIYMVIRTFIGVPSLAILMFYMPMKLLLSMWLPQYAESLKYLAILLPMCVFEGRTQLLINTYLKTLRKENLILTVNILTVFISLVTTGISVYVFENMDVAVAAIIVMMIFKCFVAELLISKLINISIYKDTLLEILLTAIFIIGSWIIGGYPGLVLYIVAFGIYLIIKWKNIKYTIKSAKSIMF